MKETFYCEKLKEEVDRFYCQCWCQECDEAKDEEAEG